MSLLNILWLKIKSYFNNSYAMFNLGQRYFYGITVGVDLKKSYKLLSKAASLGRTDAKEMVDTQFVVDGDEVRLNPDVKDLYEFYREKNLAIGKGDPEALYFAAQLEISQCEDKRNLKFGLKCARQAADKKYYPAVYLLGVLYYNGNKCVRKDLRKAWRLIDDAANHGVVQAINFISQYKDPLLALPLYEKFYAEGNKSLGLQLGLYCLDNLDKDGCSLEKGLDLMQEACEDRNSVAALKLGIIYDLGKFGCAPDLKKAIEYYEKAAELGNDDAMNCLGDKYLYFPEIQDYDKAFDFYSKAYSLGNYNAANNLGTCYKRGVGVEQDAEKARMYYEEACSHGAKGALFNLYLLYSDGVCMPADKQKADHFLKMAAEEENPETEEAYLYAERLLGTEETHKGLDLLESAASKGHDGAQFVLGCCYLEGYFVEVNPQKGVEYFKEAAAQNNKEAILRIARCYLHGKGVERDFVEARKWLTRGAELGDPDAQYELAVCLRLGEGGAQDIYMAMHWYQKAAEQGNDRALHHMGIIYDNGIGDIDVDFDKAFEYYSQAAEMGNRDSIFCLGCMYLQGKGVEKDERQAVKLYKKAAKMGEPDSMYHLAWCYQEGIGVEPDIKTSIDYLKKSAALGWKPAIEALRQIGLS